MEKLKDTKDLPDITDDHNKKHRKNNYDPYFTNCLTCLVELQGLIAEETPYIFLIEPPTKNTKYAHAHHIDEIPYRTNCRDCKKTLNRILLGDIDVIVSVKKETQARINTSKLIHEQ